MLQPEELAVREFERSLELKTVVETKAANYMVAVALILTILTNFFIEFIKFKSEICFWLPFVVVYILTFTLGIGLLFIFVYMLKPRDIKYLTFKELAEMASDKKKKADEKMKSILKDCEVSIATNEATVKELDCLNNIVKTCAPILVFGFFVEFVLFVVFVILYKWSV